jgi:hypothetical protein
MAFIKRLLTRLFRRRRKKKEDTTMQTARAVYTGVADTEGLFPGGPLLAATDWVAVDSGAARQPDQPADRDRCRAAVDALIAGGSPGDRDRVLPGFGWALRSLERRARRQGGRRSHA